MSRFITIPEPIRYADPITGSYDKVPNAPERGELCSFSKSCRLALAIAAQRISAAQQPGQQPPPDILEIYDLRRKIDEAQVGSILELTESEFRILEPEFRRPNGQVFGIDWLFSAASHVKAVLQATAEKPTVMLSSGN